MRIDRAYNSRLETSEKESLPYHYQTYELFIKFQFFSKILWV